MRSNRSSTVILVFGVLLQLVLGEITVYRQHGQLPFSASGTASAAAANYTGAAAYNPTVLVAPSPPTPFTNQFTIPLTNGGIAGLSIPQSGSFLGFSIEMSVANQVLGKNSSLLQVPFLNLMANIQQRAGRVLVRVGGNTQETAALVDNTPDGRIIEKNKSQSTNPTQTPPLVFTREMLYMMNNISSLVNVRWFLGIPFFNTTPFQLGIADAGQAILGNNLIGLQAGNEPDLYVAHQHRPSTYQPSDYFGEVGNLINAMSGDQFSRARTLLIGPNIATNWAPQDVWNTGFVDAYSNNLAYLAVERYPSDNCFAQFGVGTPHDPQTMFPQYLNHTAGTSLVSFYTSSANFAQSKGKQLLMFETNTASCGGFAGISDSFGAALWGLDYAMQMAYSNFSGALWHVGGQNVFYNYSLNFPSTDTAFNFIAPPTNQSTFHQWTIGPVYYSALIMAEALGPSNTSQITDLGVNNNNIFTPAYAIYENGNPVRVALFNYITDPSGASDITVSIAIGGGNTGQPPATPAQVKVKYFAASSVSQKGNFSWAGQTFGSHFDSDGRLQGTEDISTVTCDQNANTCQVKVHAPGFALVFLTDKAFTETAGAPSTTFQTTVHTKTHNTATIDPSILATSNGHTGMKAHLGSTSKGSFNGASSLSQKLPGVAILMTLLSGAVVIGRALVR